MSAFAAYSTPSPSLLFSKEFFEHLTLAQAALLDDDYPIIASRHSLKKWVWSSDIPHSESATSISPGEVILHPTDIQPLLAGMQDAFGSGSRSVVVDFVHNGEQYQYCYSFAKLQLMKLVHTYDGPRRNAFRLLQHLNLLHLDDRFYHAFKACGFLDGLRGFYSSSCPLYNLASLLDETWLEEDIFNALCELEYFRQHARIANNDPDSSTLPPSDIIIPTDFLRDMEAAEALGKDFANFPSCRLLRKRLESTVVSSVNISRIENGHFTALTFDVGANELVYGDSMHLTVPPGLGEKVSRALSTWVTPIPASVKQGTIARQGGGNGGDGSCGVAALNFIQTAIDLDTQPWSGSRAQYFRNILLVSLVKYHCLAAERKGEGFLDWVDPVSNLVEKEMGKLEEEFYNATSSDEFPGIAYKDFNLYTPLKAHPIFTFLEQSSGVQWHNENRGSPTPPTPPYRRSPPPRTIAPHPVTLPSFSQLASRVLHRPTLIDRKTLPSVQPLLPAASLVNFTPEFASYTAPIKRERSGSLDLSLARRRHGMGKRQHSDIGKERREGRVGSVKVEDIKGAFEDSSEDDIEIIDHYKTHLDEPYDSDIEVIEPHTPPSRPRVINLVTPERPTIHVKKESTGHAIPRKTTSAPWVKPEPIDVKLESKNTSHSGHRNGPIVTAAEPSPRSNQIYSTLPAAVTAVLDHQRRQGHIMRRAQSRLKDGVMKKLTLRCNHYSTHNPRHRADIDPSDWRRGKSVKTNCMAHVNINLIRETGEYRITHVDWAHNHAPEIPEGGSARDKPTKEQKALIQELATTCVSTFSRAHIGAVIKTSTGTSLEPRQISNIINESRREARNETKALGGDIPAIIASLEQKELENPGWFWRLHLSTAGVVDGVFWQSPEQVALARRYGDVLLADSCYDRNDVGYPLTIGVGVDGHCASRNTFYAVHATEDAVMVRWILKCYLDSVGYHPTTLLSDRHATLLSVVPSSFPMTDHLYCIHHLNSNVDQNLRRTIGTERWPAFKAAFFQAYRAVSPNDFDEKWACLIETYPAAAPYLSTQLYPCREKWAYAWTSYKFTCGIRTNGRVESENRVNKAFAGPKKSLKQLFDGLVERTKGQTVQEMTKIRDSSRRQHPGQIEGLFPGPLRLIREFGGPFAVQTCFRQMELSVFFLTEVLQLPEGTRSWNEYAVHVENETGFQWSNGEENNMINSFTNEEAYIGLQWLLRLVLGRGHRVRHLLRVVHRGSNRAHMVAILEDNNYVCDCAMGMSLGLPCRHYFQVLLSVRDLRFHLGLIRRRWLHNPNIDISAVHSVAVNEANVTLPGPPRTLALPSPAGLQPSVPSPSTLALSNEVKPQLQPSCDTTNPLHILPAANVGDVAQLPPLTQTLPAREIYHETHAALRPLMSAVRTQEELEDLLQSFESIRRQQEASQREDTLQDPTPRNPKGRPRTQRLTGPTEPGRPRGGGGAGAAPPARRQCGLCRQYGHNRTRCPNALHLG